MNMFPRLALGASCAFFAASPLVAEPLPDFSLTDENLSSDRYGDTVSPRDYLHQVTAYYFGAAT